MLILKFNTLKMPVCLFIFKGFKMMEMFGLVEKDFSSMEGVSMEPGTFNVYPCYRLHKDALVSQPTKYVFIARY